MMPGGQLRHPQAWLIPLYYKWQTQHILPDFAMKAFVKSGDACDKGGTDFPATKTLKQVINLMLEN